MMDSSNKPILSIIVPAYNAEKTLRRCIDSLLYQNSAAIEIIISNDGCTDGTQSIIEEYVRNNSCISYVRDLNGGLSCARNRGIKVATGRWITYVDSDDYVAPGIFGKIIDILTAYEPDMLEYQYYVSTNGNHFATSPNQLPKDTILDFNWLQETIVPVALNISDKKEFFIENFVWNKVYCADIIQEHGVMFDESRRKWEDRLFSLTFLQYAKTYYSMSEYGYYYVCGSSQTLSGKFDPDILRIIMDSYRKYREMYGDEYSFDNAYTTNYFCNLLIDVAKDQFDYLLPPAALKEMFSIFVNDEMVCNLFTNCALSDNEKEKICSAIRERNVNNIYDAFEQYTSRLKRREKRKQSIDRIRYLLSRAKRVFVHEK